MTGTDEIGRLSIDDVQIQPNDNENIRQNICEDEGQQVKIIRAINCLSDDGNGRESLPIVHQSTSCFRITDRLW